MILWKNLWKYSKNVLMLLSIENNHLHPRMTITPLYELMYVMQTHGSISASYLRRKYNCTETVAVGMLHRITERYDSTKFDWTGKRLIYEEK